MYTAVWRCPSAVILFFPLHPHNSRNAGHMSTKSHSLHSSCTAPGRTPGGMGRCHQIINRRRVAQDACCFRTQPAVKFRLAWCSSSNTSNVYLHCRELKLLPSSQIQKITKSTSVPLPLPRLQNSTLDLQFF